MNSTSDQLNEAIETSITDLCMRDLDLIETNMKWDGTGFWKRTYITTALLYIEAELNQLKRVIANCCEHHESILNKGTIEILIASGVEMKVSSQAPKDIFCLKLFTDIAFIFTECIKIDGVELKLGLEHPGWGALYTTTETRKRLAHATSSLDQIVVDLEIDECRSGLKWFFSNAIDLQMQLYSSHLGPRKS